ncbi:hypothetical protein BD560DRAFT_461017 [Blakeslea trispora]|nr:hypothetical protein BD560DRAFT_461017 [Blakeslea trispora]
MGKSIDRPYTVLKHKISKRFDCTYLDCKKSYTKNHRLTLHIKKTHKGNSTEDDIQPMSGVSFSFDETPTIDAEYEGDYERNSEEAPVDEEEDEDSAEDSDFEDDEEDMTDVRNSLDEIMTERQAEWDHDVSGGSPFPNAQTMIMMCLYNGYVDMMSRSQLKTFLYGVQKIVEIAVQETKEGKVFKMPKANMIMRGDANKKFSGPSITTTTTSHDVVVKGQKQESQCSSNLPSEHLKLSMANPVISSKISALPDRTYGASKSLANGTCLIPTTTDYRWRKRFLADGYYVLVMHNSIGFLPEVSTIAQSQLVSVVNKSMMTENNCCALLPGANTMPRSLSGEQKHLLFGQNPLKVANTEGPGQFYKMVIAPIILFTDDTSVGSSKQHLPYESWSMTYAALSLEKRGCRENTMFVGCAPKSEGLNAMHFVPSLAADLLKLEMGILLYSSHYDEIVLVKAPLLFISADNPAHSDICGIMQQTTLYFCRKCYTLKQSKKKRQTLLESNVTPDALNKPGPKRFKSHYVLAATQENRKDVRMESEMPGSTLTAADYSYKNTGSKDLLHLESFDPTLDTPVEVLHCLPLGVVKYLVTHLVKVTSLLQDNRSNTSYSRNYRGNLRHVGSFVGRDFKKLIQVLPLIIEEEFTDNEADANVLLLKEPLKGLAKLCSLVFIRETATNLEEYAMVHYLHHPHEDILRFGCALQYETEKGEMYNKFIREQLFHTNRHSPSKDVAVRFGKQEVLRHIIDGGSWVNKECNRVKYGQDIESVIKSNRDEFMQTIFGVRGLSDPGYDPVKGKPEPKFLGVFEDEYENRFIGVVCCIQQPLSEQQNKVVAFKRYKHWIQCIQVTGSVYIVLKLLGYHTSISHKDGVSVRKYTVAARRSESLLECQATDEVFELVALQPLGILDTHSAFPTINFYVNLFKFETITLLNSCNIYSYH